jgi:hypothetical protein
LDTLKRDLLILCDPNKSLKRTPFIPISIYPLDMFPNTKQFITVVILKRLKIKDMKKSTIKSKKTK